MTDQSAQLLRWAAAKIEEAQEAGVYGTVTIFLEAGTIVRAKTEMQDKPPEKSLYEVNKRG